jgi:hypothetical protein
MSIDASNSSSVSVKCRFDPQSKQKVLLYLQRKLARVQTGISRLLLVRFSSVFDRLRDRKIVIAERPFLLQNSLGTAAPVFFFGSLQHIKFLGNLFTY